MNGRCHNGGGVDQSSLTGQEELDVRVTAPFPQTGPGPLHRHTAADHQVDVLHVAHRHRLPVDGRPLDRGGLAG